MHKISIKDTVFIYFRPHGLVQGAIILFFIFFERVNPTTLKLNLREAPYIWYLISKGSLIERARIIVVSYLNQCKLIYWIYVEESLWWSQCTIFTFFSINRRINHTNWMKWIEWNRTKISMQDIHIIWNNNYTL